MALLSTTQNCRNQKFTLLLTKLTPKMKPIKMFSLFINHIPIFQYIGININNS